MALGVTALPRDDIGGCQRWLAAQRGIALVVYRRKLFFKQTLKKNQTQQKNDGGLE